MEMIHGLRWRLEQAPIVEAEPGPIYVGDYVRSRHPTLIGCCEVEDHQEVDTMVGSLCL